MGAENHIQGTGLKADATDKEIGEAYDSAVEDAAYELGHGGYTGSIAESQGLCIRRDLVFTKDDDIDIDEFADKWGPTVAIVIDGHIAFAGIYSS